MVQQRFELYRPIHKAIRHMMFATANTLGIADFRDDTVAQDALGNLEQTINMLKVHAGHEETYAHPELEKRAPGFIAAFEQDHQHDDEVYAELRRLSQDALNANSDQKAALGIEIYRMYNAFVGEYLGHLVREETELQQAFWDNFTDEELGAIEGAIMAAVSPDVMAQFLPLVCGSMNPDELSFMLGGMKMMAPPAMFAGVVQMAEQATPPQNWAKVKANIA